MRARSISYLVLPLLLSVFLISFFGCEKQQEPPEQGTTGVERWQVIGPGGGGSQYEPTISPADPNHVFVRCDMTGAYVTENGGNSWRIFNLRTVVQDFEFDPNNPATVYASNNGLYRSEDKGRRWRLIYPDPANVTSETMTGDHAGQRFITKDGMPDGSIVKVHVNPADSDIIFLGLSPSWRSGKPCRVLVSTDRGASWKVLAEIPGRRVLGIFPGSWEGAPGEAVVLTDRACIRVSAERGLVAELSLPVPSIQAADGGKGTGDGVIYVLSGISQQEDEVSGGIYRSDDLGQSWRQVNGNLVAEDSAGGMLPGFRTLAVCENQPEIIYLSCSPFWVSENGNPQRYRGIFKSENGGETWNWSVTVAGGKVLTRNFTGGWLKKYLGWFGNPSHLGVCPTNPDVCYATDSGRTYKTEDGGANWQQVISEDFPDGSATSRGLDVTTTYGIHFDPFDKNHFFITYTDIGLFHTFDSGKSWHHSITGIPRQWRNTCYWLEFDPAARGRIWACWSNVHDLPRPKMFRSGNLVNGRQQGGVSLSGDGGRWWELLHKGVMINGEYRKGMRLGAVCTHILLDPESPVDSRTLYVCDFGYGVWKTVDGGRTWEVKNKGLKGNLNAWRMAFLPTGRLILLVARGGIEGREVIPGALYYSDDQAESWQPMALPERVTAPNDLVFDPTEPKRMYLSCWPLNVKGAEIGGGLYRTEDGGRSWKQVFSEDMHVYAAAVDPFDPNTIYINTFNSAAFRSDDRGENWQRLGGYNFKWGHRPVPDPHNQGKLFLTSFGGSVFYGPAKGVPGAFEDIENLPAQRW